VADPQQPARKTGVLFVNSPDIPGADTFIHWLTMRGLDRSRFDVHAACSAEPSGATTPAYQLLSTIPDLRLRRANFGPSLVGLSRAGKFLRLAQGVPPMLGSFGALARYIRTRRIRIIHATDRPRDAVSCVLLAKMTGAMSVVHLHVKCAEWMGGSVRWAFGQADALIGVSRFVAGSLTDNGYSPRKTHAVLNAIDVATWNYRLDPSGVRLELGIRADAPVVSCAARLFRGKGQDEMIRAIAAARNEFPNVRLLIVGTEDRYAMRSGFLAELKALTTELALDDHVIFTGHRADMPAVMAASDVFALPSLEEPFGLVFLEAMAMKKPVVAFNSGGAPEVVEHGKSGLLSPAGDHAALAANLVTLLRDPALRDRMGEYGRRQVEAHFTPERMARDVETVYDSLLAPASPVRPETLRVSR
jgi:glycosyltransferase involved in cell wall biosynthesis